jgi:hypothetical protein
MTARLCLAWAPLLFSLSACRDQETRALQIREAEFRLKEAELRLKETCFASGTKFFHEFVEKTGAELVETFYSPKRNSCICETRRRPFVGPVAGAVSFELHDCLSFERLSETSERSFGGPNRTQLLADERQRQKDALK